MREEAIAILRVNDAEQALQWYARLGFEHEWTHRFEPDLPAFVSIVRGTARLFLSEHTGDARPDTLVYLRIPDVDTIAKQFDAQAHNAEWGREIELVDPSGNRLRIGSPHAM